VTKQLLRSLPDPAASPLYFLVGLWSPLPTEPSCGPDVPPILQRTPDLTRTYFPETF